MRIIAGEWGGRPLRAPRGRAVRPTSDRAREAWMSIVHPLLAGARVLDLFAGTGALGLEALSRGAGFADFVEQSPAALRTLAANVASLGAEGRCAVHREEALRFLSRRSDPASWDVAFADPPWRTDLAAAVAEAWKRRPFAAVLGVEHEAAASLPPGGETRRYGDTAITLYRMTRLPGG